METQLTVPYTRFNFKRKDYCAILHFMLNVLKIIVEMALSVCELPVVVFFLVPSSLYLITFVGQSLRNFIYIS